MSESNSTDHEENSLANLSAFQRDILWILVDEGGERGMVIRRRLESYYGEPVNHGQLYPNLDELVDYGLVEKGRIDGRTNSYTLTEKGNAALADRLEWVQQFDSF